MYDGMWKDGEYHGDGFLLNQDGSSHTGKFKDGVPHGYGEEVAVNGTITKGYWTRGLRPERSYQ